MADDNQNSGGGEAPASWAAPLDAEHLEFIGKRGYDKLDGNAAALELAKAYRGSERLRGGLAAGDVVALPREGDAAAAKAFWEKVGAPKDPTGYVFDGLTKRDGSALDAGYTDAARQAAAKVNMPAHMLKDFLAGLQPHFDGAADAARAQQTINIDEARRALAVEWGPNEARNRFIVNRTMDTLKIDPEAAAAMMSLPKMGYVGTHKLMLQLGEMMGEARFVPGASAGTTTPDQAEARLETLKNDAGWIGRWMSGGAQEKAEFTNLTKIIHAARNGQ